MKLVKSMNMFSALLRLPKAAQNINDDEHLECVSVDQIQKVHAHINEMIQFGEAKNGALLTFNIFVFFKLVYDGIIYNNMLCNALSIIALISLLISIFFLMCSFIPKLKEQKSFNPIYFGSISTSTKDECIRMLCSLNQKDLIKYYVEQIHINSKIATNKFKYYQVSITLAFLSFIFYGALYIIK